MKATTTTETPTRPRGAVPAGAAAARTDVEVLRRFHLGAPDAPAGEVPRGARPAAFATVAPGESPPVSALELLRQALVEAQAAARSAFARRARELVAGAEALLETERLKGSEGRDPERLGTALGAAGRFLDASALSGVLGSPRLAAALDADRVARLGEAVEILRQAAGEIEAPTPALVRDTELAGAAEPSEVPGWRVLDTADPCAVAGDLFDTKAWRTARVLLAARRVRLETAGEYEPARHGVLLESGLDWQAFTRDELALLPPVVALESADRLAARGMVSLSKLLLSGRPVQVLVLDDPTGAPGADPEAAPLAGFRFQTAYLGLAQREAFVQQGSTSCPERLAAGFRRAAALARAGLHVVEAPGSPVPPEAAVAGRAHPLFQYDPEKGTSWAARMDFSGNPDAEEDWPRRAVEGTDGGAEPLPLEVHATFADVCLYAPALAGQFLPVPAGVPAEALATVPEWLALDPGRDLEAALDRVPYVLASVPGGRSEPRLVRLAISRPLALACRDRLSYWRTLQELAGVRSEYVRRAEARAHAEAEASLDAERLRLAERHAAELERVRRKAVADVVDRLTAAVLGVELAAVASPLEQYAGDDVGEVSASLLAMVSGVDADGEAAEGPPSEAVDRMMAELTGVLGQVDLEALETGGGERNRSGVTKP